MAKILGSPTVPFYYLGILAFIFLTFICHEMSPCIKVLLYDFFIINIIIRFSLVTIIVNQYDSFDMFPIL